MRLILCSQTLFVLKNRGVLKPVFKLQGVFVVPPAGYPQGQAGSHARGNVFRDVPTPQQLHEQDKYKEYLMQQVRARAGDTTTSHHNIVLTVRPQSLLLGSLVVLRVS